MPTPSPITPAIEMAHTMPEVLEWPEELQAAFLWDPAIWLRPDQVPPSPELYRVCGFLAGRGWGKTHGIAAHIHAGVEAGTIVAPCLCGPTEDRVYELQVQTLVATAPPWMPCVAHKTGVMWPTTRTGKNGKPVRAPSYTPQAPCRGGNHDLAWLTELVEWPSGSEGVHGRKEFWLNIDTATRLGPWGGHMLWDSTSKGQNELILWLLDQAEKAPHIYTMRRGSMFDNPYLGRRYLEAQAANYEIGSRRYLEEVEGQSFAESAGALWQQHWIEGNRVDTLPMVVETRLVALDPAGSGNEFADEVGIVVASAAPGRRDLYIEADLSAKLKPNQYADRVVRQCRNGAAGVVLERNHFGDHPIEAIRAKASEYGMTVRVLDSKATWPRPVPGVIVVREKIASRSKESRAGGPASLYEVGRVHHVGTHEKLEWEQTNWEPGSRRSPNRLDALAMAVTELAGLDKAKPPPRPGAIAEAAALQAKMRLKVPLRRGFGT